MVRKLLSAFARRHGLSPEACRELDSLGADIEATMNVSLDGPDLSPATPDTRRVTGTVIVGPKQGLVDLDAPAPGGGQSVGDEMSGPVETSSEQTAARAAQAQRRYRHLGKLGTGGMATVHRVADPTLRRTVALKIIKEDERDNPMYRQSMVAEAQVTSQLQHPGIIPVYELGTLPSGTLYYTMKEIKGDTLGAAIEEVHLVSGAHLWGQPLSGWNFRRLIEALLRVCEAMAYAHDHGVVHRDLKPANIMLGDYGEVLVVDWGIAKVPLKSDAPSAEGALQTIETDLTVAGKREMSTGSIQGTPGYMAPEQIFEPETVGPSADVYALGAVLYKILTGEAPFRGGDALETLKLVVSTTAEPPRTHAARIGGPPVPEELEEICLKAMAREPEERYENAGVMAEAIEGWLDGARRREKALALIDQADAALQEARTLRANAIQHRHLAERSPSTLSPTRSEQAKHDAWDKEDQAEALDSQASLAEVAYVQKLHLALEYAPELREAHQRLADYYLQRHADAEQRGDIQAAAEYEIPLRAHHQGTHDAYLAGLGTVSLETSPPNANIKLYAYNSVNRRLVSTLVDNLGPAPLSAIELPIGSYLLELSAPGHTTVRYPVHVRRQQHWDGIEPEGQAPSPVLLPRESELGGDDVVIPAGYFQAGGDDKAFNALPRAQVWVDTFIMKRFPVTNTQYIAFLDDLHRRGRSDEALAYVPRERGSGPDSPGSPIYAINSDGSFSLKADSAGDLWLPDWPVTMVNWHAARRYAQWLSENEGLHWRLPTEIEWEKAARGVDGRFFPWGNFLDPTWALVRETDPNRSLTAVVDSYPIDQSPYGVRGLGGNVTDLCADAYVKAGPTIRAGRVVTADAPSQTDAKSCVVRGGSWGARARSARCARRDKWRLVDGEFDCGFRLVRSYP